MTKKIPSIEKRILSQLEQIAGINELIDLGKKRNSKLMISQYEHLKKELTKNLFEMLKESYQITIPTLKKEAA